MSFLSASRFMAAAATVSMIAVSGGAARAADAPAVLDSYADIALAGYSDSLTTAQTLETAIDKLIAAPSENALEAARSAWRAARVLYQQTEVFRTAIDDVMVEGWQQERRGKSKRKWHETHDQKTEHQFLITHVPEPFFDILNRAVLALSEWFTDVVK